MKIHYLVSVEIGDNCFSMGKIEHSDGMFRVVNCPNLRQLEIGNNSFSNFKSLELSNDCSLQNIKFGNSCFMDVSVFVIDYLLSLETIMFGDSCFGTGDIKNADGVCRITNCPELCELTIGEYSSAAFRSFELSNVDSLYYIDFEVGCMQFVEKFSLKGM